MNRVVEMYNDGYELEEIQDELAISENELNATLREFTKECRVGNKFTEEFKQLLANRYQSGGTIYSMSIQLGISTSTASKYLKQVGIDTSLQNNQRYEVIDWNDFKQCPCCKGRRNVRNVGLHNQEAPKRKEPTHSFCSTCNTEWYAEPIKENGVIVSYETRKVIWTTVN
ncbi:hypothetical protein [Microcystis phage MaeS]|nr:hypothetical protein [Microcystis phage MaeS]